MTSLVWIGLNVYRIIGVYMMCNFGSWDGMEMCVFEFQYIFFVKTKRLTTSSNTFITHNPLVK